MANALSEQVPIRAFGIFAAIIVPVNYIMVIFMMPPAMMIYERDVKGCFSQFCLKIGCMKQPEKKLAEERRADAPEWLLKEKEPNCCVRFFCCKKSLKPQLKKLQSKSGSAIGEGLSVAENPAEEAFKEDQSQTPGATPK